MLVQNRSQFVYNLLILFSHSSHLTLLNIQQLSILRFQTLHYRIQLRLLLCATSGDYLSFLSLQLNLQIVNSVKKYLLCFVSTCIAFSLLSSSCFSFSICLQYSLSDFWKSLSIFVMHFCRNKIRSSLLVLVLEASSIWLRRTVISLTNL